MLRILDGWPDLASMPLADAVHVQVEAKRLAYADMERYVGDDANVEHLLDVRPLDAAGRLCVPVSDLVFAAGALRVAAA